MTSCIHSLAVAEASGGPATAACAFESAARHAADQIVLRHDYDADGRILSANSLFCDVTGFRDAEIVGHMRQHRIQRARREAGGKRRERNDIEGRRQTARGGHGRIRIIDAPCSC